MLLNLRKDPSSINLAYAAEPMFPLAPVLKDVRVFCGFSGDHRSLTIDNLLPQGLAVFDPF